MRNVDALKTLVGSPDLSSKRWVWEQYDHLILGNTVQVPGGDAAIVRVEDGPKGLALTADVTPRYCEADPVAGGRQAVAEAWRNITAVGGRPLALTDNLNFGNPERPDVMGQLVGCIRGIGEACRALDFPVVSGNVSLYNETNGRGILPTPTIGGVGLLDDVSKHATIAFKREGDLLLLIGVTQGWLGQSLYLRDICGREDGAPPPVDLEAERTNGDFVRHLIRSGLVDTVHDCSDGGLAVAVAEMAMAGGIGASLPECPLDLSVPRLPVRRGPGPLRHRRRPGHGSGHPLQRHLEEHFGGHRRRHRRRLVDPAGRRDHIGCGAEVGARALAAGLYGGRAGLTEFARMAMDARDIERLIKEGIPDARVEIRDLAGDGDHYAATVTSATFKGKSRVQQHQMVYSALQGRMGGALHALALTTVAAEN